MKINIYSPKLVAFFFAFILIFVSCKSNSQDQTATTDKSNPDQTTTIFKDVSVAEAKQMIAENQNLIIVDVRTPEEIAEGKIEGALEIDYNAPDFSAKMSELDKDKEYLIYCRSGGRSARCLDNMKEMGFKNAYNMVGGFNEWK